MTEVGLSPARPDPGAPSAGGRSGPARVPPQLPPQHDGPGPPAPATRRGAHRARRRPARIVVPLLAAGVVLAGGQALAGPGDERPVAPAGAAESAQRAVERPVERRPPTAPPAAPSLAQRTALQAAAEVVVLNQTDVTGLAAAVADGLTGRGWTVTGVANFYGIVPATTVYYPDGQRRAAAAVAADLPGPDRVRPRFGNLSTSRLTVVVTGRLSGFAP